MNSRRSVVAAFRERARLRSAVRALAAAGLGRDALTYVAGAEALKSWGLAVDPSGGRDREAQERPAEPCVRTELPAQFARQLEREIAGGAVALFVRVRDADEEKRASMALLRHSDGAVRVHDLAAAPCDQAAAAP